MSFSDIQFAILYVASYSYLLPVTSYIYSVGGQSLGFISISTLSRRYLIRDLNDGVSDPIYIPYGFAFGNETFTKAYVSKRS